MELRAEHLFSAPPQKVARAMVDPEFASGWDQILDVAAVEVLDHGSDGESVWLAARLTYGGSLAPAIEARIDAEAQLLECWLTRG